jgi:hypothetical protein
MRTIWFSLGFVVALVVIGVMALVPLMRPQASDPWPVPWPTAVLQPTTPPATPVPHATATPQPARSGLTWQRIAPFTGRCDRLIVDERHLVHYAPCDEGTRVTHLTQAELDAYLVHVQRLASFAYAVQDSVSTENATVQLAFNGLGHHQATLAEQTELAAWAKEVYERVLEQERRSDLVAAARLDLAGRHGLTTDSIAAIRSPVSIDAVIWPDACLGIVSEGLFCAQVRTPGYRIVLSAGDVLHEYRADGYGVLRHVPASAP